MKKSIYKGGDASVGKIPRFFEASRDQIVNKTWVNKQLTLVYGIFVLSKKNPIVNKQLTVYSIRYYVVAE